MRCWSARRAVGLGLACLALAGCARDEKPAKEFGSEEPASAHPAMVLRSDTSRTPRGFLVAEMDVLLMPGATEATARASLQQVIDSLAKADTLAAAIRVVGFVIGEVDSQRGTAQVVPTLSATWGPIDSTGFTGSRRSARFRTHYVLLRPFTTGGTTGGTTERKP